MKTKILKIVFTIVLTFSFYVNVLAFEQNTQVIQKQGDKLIYNGKVPFYLKFYDAGNVQPVAFCTQFRRISPAERNITCSLKNSWSTAISTGVASIIEKVGVATPSVNDISPEKYYYGEIAINEFLCNSGLDTDYTCIHNRDDLGVTSIGEILGDYYSWYEEAISVRNAYNQAALSFSESKLIFTKRDDNYVSNNFQINQSSFGNADISVNIEGGIGELKKDGNNYYVAVPINSVLPGSSIDISVTAKASKIIPIARQYYCGDTYQDITPNILEEDVLSKNASIGGTLRTDIERGSLEITKVDSETQEKLGGVLFELYSGNNCSGMVILASRTADKGIALFDGLPFGEYSYKEKQTKEGYELNTTCKAVNISSTERVRETMTNNKKITNRIEIIKINNVNGKALAGAKLHIEDDKGKTVKEWITTEAAYIIDDMALGTYYVVEDSAPTGYILNKEKTKFVVDRNTSNLEIKVKNDLTKIKINKISVEDNKPLVGAKLYIEDSDGKVVKEWVTDGNSYIIEGLEYGTYYVAEDSAPIGYVLNKEKTKFVVDENTDNLEIEIKNKLITVEISKISAVDNKELKGASLQILDKDKNKISCAIRKTEKENEKLEECTWVSGDKPTTIIGLLPGKYYLKETIAPEGYVLNEEMVEFEIKEDGTANPVKMKNELEVEVPNTLSSRSTLLIAISMFDIALGIGILTYVKKHKIEE